MYSGFNTGTSCTPQPQSNYKKEKKNNFKTHLTSSKKKSKKILLECKIT